MRALEYLDQRALFGIKLGLGPMRTLLERLGQPELAAPTLLVAGTNGKGSVVAVLDAALRGAGLRVGRYTSPHLRRLNERIAVDGAPIADTDLEQAVARVRSAAEALVAEGRLSAHPTYFEAVTAAAFLHFAAAPVDVAVLEVGLGGRLDATNTADPRVSAVVSIGLDHEQHLGRGLTAIAREKAGVMRAGRVTVRGPMPAEARRALEASAEACGARLVDAEAGAAVEERPDGRLDVVTPLARHAGIRPLPGAHQRANLMVAMRVLEQAREAGLDFDLAAAAAGASDAQWPGRLQEIAGRPALLLDGAHNPDGARALADHLRGSPPWVLLFGAMADKDVEAMAAALFSPAAAVVLVGLGQARAATPEELARRCGATTARRCAGVHEGLDAARALAGPAGRVVVAGSLYLVGEVLDALEVEAAGARPRRGPL